MTNLNGRFQVLYKSIKKEVTKLRDEFSYLNDSKAFAHWYLEKFLNLDENTIGECIIDGEGDNGIDAIVLENKKITLYQFKFPDNIRNISKQIDEKTALKLINGYKKLISSREPSKGNVNFKNFREMIKDENIFLYEFCFVSYTDVLSDHAKDALETEKSDSSNILGITIIYDVIDKKKICDKFDRYQRVNSIEIDLKYTQLTNGYNQKEVQSWIGCIKASEILEACKDVLGDIFDENIRNFEGFNPINKGIIETASSEEESFNFYFYHNGIVFIADKCENSLGNQTVHLTGAAVVNGCQTVMSLQEAYNSEGLKENVFIPLRIIQTSDIDLRSKITEYLNSQTEIRDSYFLSNNTFIRILQSDLEKKGYFLERHKNEYMQKKRFDKVAEYPKNKILDLEKTIQIYTGYFDNANAHNAKRGKNTLFNKETILEIISEINADKVITAISAYEKIGQIIKKYRKCYRTQNFEEFISFMGITVEKNETIENVMDQYSFMNTADFLLLNTYSNISGVEEENNRIVETIKIVKNAVSYFPKMTMASFTKNSKVFALCRGEKI